MIDVRYLLDAANWQKVTSIDLVRISPFGDCVVTLAVGDGRGVVLRLYDPERKLDSLSSDVSRYDDPALELFSIVDARFGLNAQAIHLSEHDGKWRAVVRLSFKDDQLPTIMYCSARDALALFGKSVPVLIAKDDPQLCRVEGHREAILFALRGGDDARDALSKVMLSGEGITVSNPGELWEDQAPETSAGEQTAIASLLEAADHSPEG